MSDPTDAALDALVKRLNDKCEREFSYDRDADEAADAITALRTERAKDHAEINLKADFIEATLNQLAASEETIESLRSERDAAFARESAAYARGVHDAAAIVRKSAELYASKDANFICSSAALDIEALAEAPPVVGVTQETVLKAAGQEYVLDHILETSEERMGRHSAVRGMMVRLGLYGELEAAIDAALADAPPAPVVGVKPLVWMDIDGAGPIPCIYAGTPFGNYYIDYASTGNGRGYRAYFINGPTIYLGRDITAAKAASQADYEARIRAALEGGDA